MEHLIHQRLATCVIVLILVLALPIQKMTRAQSGSGYELTWSSIDGGGYMFSTGGGYSLGGTMGQPDAGTMSGGGYALVGGFWGGATTQYRIYLPVVLRSS